MADTNLGKDGICRILSLDGGGAKGFYTLGVLREIEGMIKCPLHERFDLIFGTSTGAIIAAGLFGSLRDGGILEAEWEFGPGDPISLVPLFAIALARRILALQLPPAGAIAAEAAVVLAAIAALTLWRGFGPRQRQ